MLFWVWLNQCYNNLPQTIFENDLKINIKVIWMKLTVL